MTEHQHQASPAAGGEGASQLKRGLGRFQKEKRMMSQRKDYHIYSCPGCGQKIRIPRGGFKKVEIECPKCHTKFIKRR